MFNYTDLDYMKMMALFFTVKEQINWHSGILILCMCYYSKPEYSWTVICFAVRYLSIDR